MSVQPDDRVRCRCGSATYLVPGYAETRTCVRCGYLTSYCRCNVGGGDSGRPGFRLPPVSDRAKAVLGAAMVSALAVMFAVSFASSPFGAVFMFGAPLELVTALFVYWLREGRRPEVARAPAAVTACPPANALADA